MSNVENTSTSLAEKLLASVAKASGGKKQPYAGKEKGTRKPGKLPVPPPKPAQQAASAGRTPEQAAIAADIADRRKLTKKPLPLVIQAGLVDDPKKDGIPLALQVQNRQPLTPEQQAKVDAAKVAAAVKAGSDEHQRELREKQKATKKAKARESVAKNKAKKERAAQPVIASTPLTGKAALRAIAGKAAAEHAVTKIPAGKAAKRAEKAKAARKPVKGTQTAPKAKKAAAGARTGTKLVKIVELLSRKQGCTTAEVLKATGWPSVSMPQQAKAAGLKLRKEKKSGEVTRYFGS